VDIFVEGLNILSNTFRVCADGPQGISKAFHCAIFIFASLKLYTDFENAY
jgi:hypothetical protein